MPAASSGSWCNPLYLIPALSFVIPAQAGIQKALAGSLDCRPPGAHKKHRVAKLH